MLKMTIDNEEVLSNNDISIKEEILSPSSTILNNVYPKTWEQDKDYVSRFYYPKDYSKLNIQNFSVTPEEAGTTIQVNESATLTDVDTSKESRVLRVLGNTSQEQYTGKNLLHQDQYITTRTTNGITFTNNGDGTFSITGTATANASIQILGGASQIGLESGKTYYFYSSKPYNSTDFNLSIPFAQDGTQKYLTANNTITTSGTLTNIKLSFWADNGTTVNAKNVKLMLVEGSSAGTYEPYVGETTSPNPSFPQPVNVVSGDNEIKINGKNLFQSEFIPTPTSTPNAILKAGTYTLSTCDGNNFVTNVYFRLLDMNNNLVNENGHLTSTNTQINFSTSSNYYLGGSGNSYITFTIDNDYKIGIGLLNTDGTRQVMLTTGSEVVRTYEPYIGNTYPINLPVENLFDTSSSIWYSANSSASYDSTNDTFTFHRDSGTDYLIKGGELKLEPNSTYTITFDVVENTMTNPLTNVTSNSSFVNGSISIPANTTGKYIFTITTKSASTYTYDIWLYCNSTGTLKTKIMLEKGSKANSFTPYGVTPIELCKIGTYQDYIYKDNGSWYLHKEIGKVVLDGSEYWTRSTRPYYQTPVNNIIINPSSSTIGQVVCNYFKATTPDKIWNDNENGITNQTDGQFIRLRIKDDTYTLETFKTWLSSNNLIVYYVLATPTNTLIEDTTLLEQLESLSS